MLNWRILSGLGGVVVVWKTRRGWQEGRVLIRTTLSKESMAPELSQACGGELLSSNPNLVT